jgi:galactose-1-phosphate uridylyltransferase
MVHDLVRRMSCRYIAKRVLMRSVPDEPHTEITRFSEHLKKHNAHLLLSYAQFEYENKERVVAVDEESGWIAVVPFWATWPYELLGTFTPFNRKKISLTSQ